MRPRAWKRERERERERDREGWMGLAEGRGQREFFTAHSADPAPLRSVLQVITVSAHL